MTQQIAVAGVLAGPSGSRVPPLDESPHTAGAPSRARLTQRARPRCLAAMEMRA